MTPASASPTAPSTTPELLGLWPLLLPWDLRLTPEQFERVCQANLDAVLELDADGQLIALTPTGGETSLRNAQLLFQLYAATNPDAGHWIAFDSSTGFRLPDGSVLSPDASLLRLERWQALRPEQRRGFPPLCPDLVVELASPSDGGPRGVTSLRRKMGLYQTNGSQLGWLLLSEERAVEIWRGGHQGMAERLENAPPGWRLARRLRAWCWSWRRSGWCEGVHSIPITPRSACSRAASSAPLRMVRGPSPIRVRSRERGWSAMA